MRDRRTVLWSALHAVEPDAAAVPWTRTGVTTPTLGATGLRVNVTAAELFTFDRVLVEADRVSRSRASDVIDVQAVVEVATQAPGWSSGAPAVGIAVCDGSREIAVTVGAALTLVDPSTGDVVAELQASFDPTRRRTVRIRKEASTRWVVEVDDRVVGTVPYAAAPAVSLRPARVTWGNLDASATSDATWEDVEVGLNVPVAPPWRVQQVRNHLPAAVGSRWTAVAHAVARTIAGTAEAIAADMDGVRRTFAAGRETETLWTAAGDVLPDALDPAWTVSGGTKVSVLRNRIRVTNLPIQAAVLVFAPFTGSLPATAERFVRADITIRSYVEDADDRCGPYLVVDDGTKRIHAWAVFDGDYRLAWVLADNAGASGPAEVGTRYRVAHPGAGVSGTSTHRVELVVLGETWVLLLVDGVVAHRAAYADFSAVASSTEGAGVGSKAITNTFDVENLTAGRRLTDDGRRPAFLLRLRERLLHVGGLERNDELDVWLRNRFAVMAARGTTNGVIQEIRRLTQSQDSDLVREERPADWYLEATWPDEVYLESDGQRFDVFAELFDGAPNFTRLRLAEIVAWYLLPVSVLELRYWSCHAVLVDDASSVPVSGTTRIPVARVDGFGVGDVVHVRDAANATRETATVTAVGADYLDVTETTGTWIAGDRVRLPLVQS